MPWCDEDVLMHTPQDIYNANQQIIEQNAKQFIQHEEEIDEAAQQLQQHGAPEHLWDWLVPGTQQQNLEAEMEEHTVLTGFDEHETVEYILQDNDHTGTMNTALGKQYTKEAHKELLTNKQYYKAKLLNH